MQVGDIVSGYENQDGVYLHAISNIDEVNGTIEIEINLYDPDHQDFAWAISQLQALPST